MKWKMSSLLRKPLSAGASLLLLLMLAGGSRPAYLRAEGTGSKAVLAGTFSDACPCKIPCTCWRMGKANVERCFNVHVYSVTKSTTETSRPATFVFIGIPNQPYDAPSPYKLFVDDHAPKATVEQMTAFFRREYGITSGLVQPMSMDAAITPNSHVVKISEILSYEVKPAGDTLAPEVRGFLYPWLQQPQQWRASRVRYNYQGQSADFAGTNSVWGQFRISVPASSDVSVGSHAGCSHLAMR